MSAGTAPAVDACRADPVFPAIKEMVVSRTGMAFYRDRDEALARAVGARIAALALPCCDAYRRHLLDAGHAAEWDTLVDQITIGETYFFRYPVQFDALRDVVFPDLVKRRRGQRRLRIWSAGCATGPEPYSLAILLYLDLPHLIAGWDISILGTDISRGKLTRAAAGEFSDWELRQMPERYRSACFDRDGSGWRIRPAFKRNVSFRAHNLLESDAWPEADAFDLILCRNVMIYFDVNANRELTRVLHGGLADGGWLIVGHAEPHLDIANLFQPWPYPGTTLYRKWADRPALATPASAGATEWQPSPELGRWAPLATPVPHTAPHLAPQTATPARPDAAAVLTEARRLANGGDWTAATGLCQQLIDLEPLDADAHYLLALILGHQGQEAAAQSLRRAVYIDRGFALAHYQLGRLASDAADPGPARRSLRNALAVLDGVNDDHPVRGGEGLTAAELRELTRLHLRQIEARR